MKRLFVLLTLILAFNMCGDPLSVPKEPNVEKYNECISDTVKIDDPYTKLPLPTID